MPQVTVYIREGDIEKWKSLQGKSEFIHNALNPREIAPMRPLTQADIDGMGADLAKAIQKDAQRVKPIKNPKTIGVPDMFSRVKLVEPMEEKIVDGVKMKGADTTNGYYLEAEVIKTPARKALKPLTKGHITYFKKK